MRVTYDLTDLTPSFREEAVDATVNGQQVVEVADFVRAVHASVFPRGNRVTEFAFRACRVFASEALAGAFFLTHHAALPDSGVLTVEVGPSATPTTFYLSGAALADVRFGPWIGASVWVSYLFRAGAAFTTETPTLPDELEGTDMLKRNTVAIADATRTGAVTFSSAFGAAPSVVASVEAPDGSSAILGVTIHSVTAAGFSWLLTAPTPATGYTLHWQAVGAAP